MTHPPERIAHWIDQLAAPQPDERIAAEDALVQAGEPAIAPLAHALQQINPNMNTLYHAANALRRLHDPRAVDHLLPLLASEAVHVREQAVLLLGEVGDDRAVPPLITALHDPSPVIVNGAIAALGMVGDDRAVTALLPFLHHETLHVRAETTTALGNIGTPAAVDALLSALHNPQLGVQPLAATALGQAGDARAMAALIPLITPDGARAAVEIIHTPGIEDGEPYDKRPDVARALRIEAIIALGNIGDARAVPFLLDALRDPAPRGVSAAVRALGQLGAAQAVDPLATLLRKADQRLARTITTALEQIGTPEALATLDAWRAGQA